MNWKKFLKQDWRKIVIFVVILFFSLILFIFLNLTGGLPPTDEQIAQRNLISSILMIINWPLNIIGENSIINLILLVLDFVWIYLLSCLIVWIYDKLKKR
jgi:hypothetical protein